MSYVYAKANVVTANNGGRLRLKEGDPYDADHPLVLAHPELFSETPPKVNGERPVETATAEPGVKRRTRAR